VAAADTGRIPPGSIVFNSTVKDYRGDAVVRETRYQVYNKDREKSLVKTIFPERQSGRKLLMDNDNLWFYTPDIKRPTRVSMQQKLTGEVANGDLARTNFSGDYGAKLVGIEDKGGQKNMHLALTANHKGVTYSKIDYWVTVKDVLPLRAIFYAVSGKKLKTAEYTNVQTVLGKKCVTVTTFTDALDTSRRSILTYSNFERTTIPASLLSKEGLSE